MLQHPSLSRSAAAPLAGGDVASPPPGATSAAARSPRAAATFYEEAFPSENGPLERQAAENWFYDQLDVIDCNAFDTLDALGDEGLIRRWIANTTREERDEQRDAILRGWLRETADRAPDAIPVSAARRECERERRPRDERPIVTSASAPEAWASDPFAELKADIATARLAVWTMAVIAGAVISASVVTLLAFGGVL